MSEVMSVAEPNDDDSTLNVRLLASVGVSELEEKVYLLLINDAPLKVTDVAERLGLSQHRARAALSGLEAQELVSRSVTRGRPAEYRPAPPEVIVPALVLRRQEELARTRLAAVQWAEQARRTTARSTLGPDMLELVSGPEATGRQLDQLQRAAEHEVCALDRPPYMTGGSSSPSNPAEDDGLARGVSYRAIYDPQALTYPWQPDALRHYMQAGEQARVYPDLPTKMMIVDGRVALIPLDARQPGGESLLVRAPAVVDTLTLFFETLWTQATRLPTAPSDTAGLASVVEATDQRLTEDLVNMMVAGLKDDAIARKLGMSSRTLDRRLQAFMLSLGARTRFQAGWQAHSRLRPTSDTT